MAVVEAWVSRLGRWRKVGHLVSVLLLLRMLHNARRWKRGIPERRARVWSLLTDDRSLRPVVVLVKWGFEGHWARRVVEGEESQVEEGEVGERRLARPGRRIAPNSAYQRDLTATAMS